MRNTMSKSIVLLTKWFTTNYNLFNKKIAEY